LSVSFTEKLRSVVVPKILKLIKEYKVDIIEIVGHTDEQPLGWRRSNLDTSLLKFLASQGPLRLTSADNAGLGMARAAAVAKFLMSDPRIGKQYRVLPLSAAQTVNAKGRLATGQNSGDAPDRRRIEIRLRRSIGTVVTN